MNFLSLIKRLFPSQPTLDEFINTHKPETTYDVEFLERQYDQLLRSREWS